MKCPTCRKEVALTDPHIPFCSDRCKLIDLGNWAAEKYVISTPVAPEMPAQEQQPNEDGEE